MKKISDERYLFQDTCNVYVPRSGREAVLVDFGKPDFFERAREHLKES